MKRCSKCHEEKPLDQFYKWMNVCKPCRNTLAKANRQKNIEYYRMKWKGYSHEAYQKNKQRRAYIKAMAERRQAIINRPPQNPYEPEHQLHEQWKITQQRKKEYVDVHEKVRAILIKGGEVPVELWKEKTAKHICYMISDLALNGEFSKYTS